MRTAILTLLFVFITPLFLSLKAQQQLPTFPGFKPTIPGYNYDKRVGLRVLYPLDIAIDSKGDIYLSDLSLKKFHQRGFLYEDFKAEGLINELFGKVFHITVDADDNFYVSSESYSKISKFNKNGDLLFEFGTNGSEPGQFSTIGELTITSKGDIYVADLGNKRIQKFDKDGKLLHIIPLLSNSFDVDINDNLFAINAVEKKVIKYSPNGDVLMEIRSASKFSDGFMSPSRIAVDKSSGRIVVTDNDTYGSVYTYNSQGIFERRIYYEHGFGSLRGNVVAVDIDDTGNILVSDHRHNGDGRVYLFSPDGEILKKWGTVYNTVDITIDEEGYVYELDNWGTVFKFSPEGDVLKLFWLPTGSIPHPRAITTDFEGNIIVLGSDVNSNYAAIHKFDKEGKLLAQFKDFGPGISIRFTDIAVDPTGNIYLSDDANYVIRKIDRNGKFIHTLGERGTENGKIWHPKSIAVDILGIIYLLDDAGSRVQKFDANGKFLGHYRWNPPIIYNRDGNNLAVDNKGFQYILSTTDPSKFLILDTAGKIVYENTNNIATRIAVNREGTRLVWKDYTAEAYVQFLNSDYVEPKSKITGSVFADNDQDCNFEVGEKSLAGLVVEATPGPYYGITDQSGRYSIAVDSGNYKLRVVVPTEIGREIVAICPEQKVKVSGPGLTVQNINFGNKVTLSPYLTSSVSSTRRRRCFDSTTKVTYSNTGFAAAENAKVYLQLPKEVELLSADKTFTRLPNGTYVFDVGTLAAGQIGTITIQDKVVCGDESIRGLTVCTRAWISTAVESKCPVITTTAKCNTATGEVRVVIKNTGPEDMEVGELFRIYRNGQLTTVESYKLAAGDSLVLWIPASGKTVRLEAEQPGCNVSNTLASVTIEGCKVTTDPAPVSSGFVNALPPDEEEPEVAEECLLITDSYDPNDKQVTPTGLTQENYTPTNTALTYKVRFQNTGTDVAYRVVVTDTLSEHLDISTLQLGTASHNYRYEVSGKGRPVLSWTFDNIMLPDSTTNEPGSHGYIQFSIKPKADLPEKTAVENFADIFFDFNSPVRTNTTINRIYDMPEEITETDRLDATKLIATPVLEGFSPASGKLGAEVILTGKKFSAVAANNKVLFNGVQATVLAASENELKVQVPANATSGNIKVQTLDGAANSATGFEVYQPPVVSGFMPAEGIAGTTVTLQGNHLTEAWLQSIKLGDLACEIISISGTGVVVKVPAGANSDTFQILSKGGQAQSVSRFIVWHQPAISNLSTVLDKVGATILITGSNFAPEATRNIVWFGAAKAQVLQATTTTLKVKVPAGATSGIITLETPGGTAQSPAIFEVIPAPQVFTFKPAAGSVGSEVELTGAHFLTFGKQDTITFNGQKAVVLEASPDQFKVRVPRGATSGKITVAGVGGQAITSSEFKVEELSPEQAIEVYPNPTNGNFTIRFAHADFEIQEIQLFSTLGTLVYSEKVSSPRPEQLDVKLTSPKTGIYILHIKTERGLIIKKLHIL